MCRVHWSRVPKELQQALWRAYNHGRGIGTPAYREAREAAIQSVPREEPLTLGF